jgi:hypothetical protein
MRAQPGGRPAVRGAGAVPRPRGRREVLHRAQAPGSPPPPRPLLFSLRLTLLYSPPPTLPGSKALGRRTCTHASCTKVLAAPPARLPREPRRASSLAFDHRVRLRLKSVASRCRRLGCVERRARWLAGCTGRQATSTSAACTVGRPGAHAPRPTGLRARGSATCALHTSGPATRTWSWPGARCSARSARSAHGPATLLRPRQLSRRATRRRTRPLGAVTGRPVRPVESVESPPRGLSRPAAACEGAALLARGQCRLPLLHAGACIASRSPRAAGLRAERCGHMKYG